MQGWSFVVVCARFVVAMVALVAACAPAAAGVSHSLSAQCSTSALDRYHHSKHRWHHATTRSAYRSHDRSGLSVRLSLGDSFTRSNHRIGYSYRYGSPRYYRSYRYCGPSQRVYITPRSSYVLVYPGSRRDSKFVVGSRGTSAYHRFQESLADDGYDDLRAVIVERERAERDRLERDAADRRAGLTEFVRRNPGLWNVRPESTSSERTQADMRDSGTSDRQPSSAPQPASAPPAAQDGRLAHAWRVLADGDAERAIRHFSILSRRAGASPMDRAGYALAAGVLDRPEAAVWGMRRAVLTDAAALGYPDEAGSIRAAARAAIERLDERIARDGDESAEGLLFVRAAAAYLAGDEADAAAWLDRAEAAGDRHPAVAALRKQVGASRGVEAVYEEGDADGAEAAVDEVGTFGEEF